ncbi:uncharacterized protein LOC120252573 [Dioscorea cayenensis subsp. rotundata]|uniref:Uncharacterized protein LOC120252573 n=1 Tax=Dioscorea cayennensis subsp. rotundata TaxID=55577 RepID=A0AB40ANS6_DIOCR|nr:uncharacterized protein LOC120252573 [Dioscorea cayenensis subsp. rotundata]
MCRNLKGLGKVEDGLMSKLQNLKVIDVFPSGWVDLEELKKLKKHNNIKGIGMRVVSNEVLQQLSCLPTAWLCLANMDNLDSLSFDILSCKDDGFLKELEIRSCPQITKLVMNGRETHLNNLTIYDVKQLQNISWENVLPQEFFRMLKRLFIYKCKLASVDWVLHLPCLIHLHIQSCTEIETLFNVEEEREIQQVSKLPVFPHLECLELAKLPKLMRISNFTLDFPRLSHLSVTECLNLQKDSFELGFINHQIRTHCDREWRENLECEAKSPPTYQRDYFWRVTASTVVLKIGLHSELCEGRILKTIVMIEGVERVWFESFDASTDLVMVKGTMDVKNLLEVLKEKLNNSVEIMPAKKYDAGAGDKKDGGVGGGGDEQKEMLMLIEDGVRMGRALAANEDDRENEGEHGSQIRGLRRSLTF